MVCGTVGQSVYSGVWDSGPKCIMLCGTVRHCEGHRVRGRLYEVI